MPENTAFMNFRPGDECSSLVDKLLETGEWQTRTELLQDSIRCLAREKGVSA